MLLFIVEIRMLVKLFLFYKPMGFLFFRFRHYTLFNIASYIELHCLSHIFLRLRVSQTVKAFTYVSWLNGYLGGKQGWVSRANFTTTEAEDVKRFICFRDAA